MESFHLSKGEQNVTRKVTLKQFAGTSALRLSGTTCSSDLDATFEKTWLMLKKPQKLSYSGPHLSVVDLFAGCGGLSVGIQAAAHSIGGQFEAIFASDIDEGALRVYSENLSPKYTCSKPIEQSFNLDLAAALSLEEKRLKKQCGQVDFLIGGPPCQGHSDLNNHSRRNDPRNELYAVMGRAASVFEPTFLIIENVLGVRHSSIGVVEKTTTHLNKLGYQTASIVLNAADYGVAQNRKRHFTLAMNGNVESLERSLMALKRKVRSVMWAIDDLIDEPDHSIETYRTAAMHSATNKRRIDYLFDNELYELPDSERPDCHRLKPHAYNSVYGRMRPNGQAPTITSGFGSTGQGRFVHPLRRRTLTPHEAARIQFFPDWFSFGDIGRRQFQKYIGNAVPPKLGYVLGLALLNTVGGGS
jgi:DNA (cytosine-5)-methyltransferase 1